MRVLIFGRGGWLAGEYAKAFQSARCVAVDIIDRNAVNDELVRFLPDVVINCAGVTGRPNVDGCEASKDSKRLTWHANAVAPALLEESCHDLGIYFVHLSSGCMWDTGNNIREGAPPRPNSYYAVSKAEGEERLDATLSLILRPRMLFDGDATNPRNLINKLARYTTVLDVPNSATFVPDLIDATRHLIQIKARGTFNVVNEGSISAASVMRLYRDIVDPTHTFAEVSYAQLQASGAIHTGRSNVTLNTDKLLDLGFRMPSVNKRMLESLHEIKAHYDGLSAAREACERPGE